MVKTMETSIVEGPVTQTVVVVLTMVVFVKDLESANLIFPSPLVLVASLMINAPTSMMPPPVPLENVLKACVYLPQLLPQPNAELPLIYVMLLIIVMEQPETVLMALSPEVSSVESKTQIRHVIALIYALVPAKSV